MYNTFIDSYLNKGKIQFMSKNLKNLKFLKRSIKKNINQLNRFPNQDLKKHSVK